jgi:Xaa-Pro aminopeptidase
MRHRTPFVILFAALLTTAEAPHLRAQAPGVGLAAIPTSMPAQMPAPAPGEFLARRQALAKALHEAHPEQRLVVVLRGASNQPDMNGLVQEQDFLYLTGVTEPGVAMLLVVGKDGAIERDELLVPPFSPFTAKWDGRFLAPGEEAAARTGFATVGNVRALERELTALLTGDSKVVALTKPAARTGSTPRKAGEAADGVAKDAFDGRPTREQAFVKKLKELRPEVEVLSLERVLHRMRPHKTAAEIALLRRCSEIAGEGIGAAMNAAQPGAYEFQLAAAARYVFSLHGCGPDAYAAIVGAGANGCILHYNACSKRLEDGDLIVMDYAPTLHGYCSDVTRTFPANGKFTPAQRKLVLDVYEIQQELIADVKPGARLSAIGSKCAKLLVARGYRNDHGPCHHVGLAVHDPSVDVLEEGMVLTVEPGAYLPDQNMGCRIEDTVLVTATGCEILSRTVPSHPDAIEAFMQRVPR